MVGLASEEESSEEGRTLDQLVVSRIFRVLKVLGATDSTSLRNGPLVMGGHISQVNGGYTFGLQLSVVAEDVEVPTNRLIFNGYSPVMSGHLIETKIPRYENKPNPKRASPQEMERAWRSKNPLLLPPTEIYVDRPFREEELAIELTILSGDGSSLRTDRGAEYGNYLPKKK